MSWKCHMLLREKKSMQEIRSTLLVVVMAYNQLLPSAAVTQAHLPCRSTGAQCRSTAQCFGRHRPAAWVLQQNSGYAAGGQRLPQVPPPAAEQRAACRSCDAEPGAQHRESQALATDCSPAGVSRRQAMRAAAAAALVAALPLGSRPAAAADSGPLMMPPPSAQPQTAARAPRGDTVRRIGRVAHSEEEWRELLTPAQYATLRQAVTERPRSSPLYTENRKGTFRCAGCGSPLFSSDTKFDAGTGWPSFYEALPGSTMETNDFSAGMRRTEVRCSACQGHLGHVFRDGPPPTNLRYCMNGVALVFEPAATSA